MAAKLKWTFLSLALVLGLGLGYYTYAFVKFSNHIQSKPQESKLFSTAPNTTKTGESLTPPKWEGKQRVNILLLGGDSRGLKPNEIPRSDSLIVASIDPVTKKAYMFSILRDTYVKIPGSGEDRINAALAIGGPNLAMKTVSDLLGIPIQYYVYTDFKGFIALVDAIDGIDIDVEKDMKYTDSADNHEYDINLKKGMQHLDGKTALQYVRFRHDALSDFARTERQRKFLQAVAQKMQTTSSILKMPRILNSVDPYIETNLSTTDMLKLGSLAYEAKTEGMVSQQIPPSNLLIEKKVGGAEVLTVDRDDLRAYIKALLDERDPAAGSTKKSGGSGSLPVSGLKSGGSTDTGPEKSGGSTDTGPEKSGGSTSAPGGTKNNTAVPGSGTTVKSGQTSSSGKDDSKTGTPVKAPFPSAKNGAPATLPAANEKNGSTTTIPSAGVKSDKTTTAAEKTPPTVTSGAVNGKANTPAAAGDTGKNQNGAAATPETNGKTGDTRADTGPSTGASKSPGSDGTSTTGTIKIPVAQ